MATSRKAGHPKLKIGSVQINNSFSGQSYLPYSTAMLQSYVLDHFTEPSSLEFLLPVFSRVKVGDAVSSLMDADIAIFSAYVWNVRLSLAIAEQLKREKPEVTIVFGGPQVPDVGSEFLTENDFIDIAVHGEGERVLHCILENFNSGDWRSHPGLSYLDKKGKFIQNPKDNKMRDLSLVPSPFLQGLFDPVMEANPDIKWIGLWETNRGCPFHCAYCDWGSDTNSKITQFEEERVYREIDWFARKEIDFIFCCDANFGALKRDEDIAAYAAKVKSETGFPKSLSVQNTKNATERSYRVQKILSDAGLNKGVTLAVQTMNEQTLINVKRQNISNESYMELQRRFTKDRVHTYSDYILGMPGDTYDTTIDGICQLIEQGQHNRIQFNNLAILPNAEMGDPEYIKKFGLETVETDIINIHGKHSDVENDIIERQELVIANNDMSRKAWRKVRSFCWLVALLHFDKVLQMPIILTRKLGEKSYREIFEAFYNADANLYPTLYSLKEFFEKEAKGIQGGNPEYKHSTKHLDIYWPHDEYILIELIISGKINDFYDESQKLILSLLGDQMSALRPIIQEAIYLNRCMLKMPFRYEDIQLDLEYNLWEVYQGYLWNEEMPVVKNENQFKIQCSSESWGDLDTYCREVIWWGNKKGAYLYSGSEPEPVPEGIY